MIISFQTFWTRADTSLAFIVHKSIVLVQADSGRESVNNLRLITDKSFNMINCFVNINYVSHNSWVC